MPATVEQAFDRLTSRLLPPDENGCRTWTGATANGYGRIWVLGRLEQTHRIVVEATQGPIPDGLVIDHLCRNKLCCESTHLEVVTDQENLRRGNGWAGKNARKTHCPRGHEYTFDNTRTTKGGRRCRECNNRDSREYRRRQREC